VRKPSIGRRRQPLRCSTSQGRGPGAVIFCADVEILELLTVNPTHRPFGDGTIPRPAGGIRAHRYAIGCHTVFSAREERRTMGVDLDISRETFALSPSTPGGIVPSPRGRWGWAELTENSPENFSAAYLTCTASTGATPTPPIDTPPMVVSVGACKRVWYLLHRLPFMKV
jgi:hypothetical protein